MLKPFYVNADILASLPEDQHEFFRTWVVKEGARTRLEPPSSNELRDLFNLHEEQIRHCMAKIENLGLTTKTNDRQNPINVTNKSEEKLADLKSRLRKLSKNRELLRKHLRPLP
jgi:hypothetical protein